MAARVGSKPYVLKPKRTACVRFEAKTYGVNPKRLVFVFHLRVKQARINIAFLGFV